jgi:hypothetical protein
MHQNMSFGSNGVDRLRSLRKIPTRICIANLCDNGTSLATFASTFVQEGNGPKHPKHELWVQWNGSGAFVAKNSDVTLFSELVR